jgi:hypothetical protein
MSKGNAKSAGHLAHGARITAGHGIQVVRPADNEDRWDHLTVPLGEGYHQRARLLEVNCWCERTTVKVSDDEVFNGRTGSCGLQRCHP